MTSTIRKAEKARFHIFSLERSWLTDRRDYLGQTIAGFKAFSLAACGLTTIVTVLPLLARIDLVRQLGLRAGLQDLQLVNRPEHVWIQTSLGDLDNLRFYRREVDLSGAGRSLALRDTAPLFAVVGDFNPIKTRVITG